MTRTVIIALIAGVLLMPTIASAKKLKIAFVDLQRALNEVEEGKRAKKRLKRLFRKRKKQLEAKQSEILKMKATLEKEVALLKEDVKRKKVIEYKKMVMELQQLAFKHRQELATKETEMTQPIFKKMKLIIDKIAKKGGYTLVLEKSESSVLFAKKTMDLTDQLIKMYNAGK